MEINQGSSNNLEENTEKSDSLYLLLNVFLKQKLVYNYHGVGVCLGSNNHLKRKRSSSDGKRRRIKEETLVDLREEKAPSAAFIFPYLTFLPSA